MPDAARRRFCRDAAFLAAGAAAIGPGAVGRAAAQAEPRLLDSARVITGFPPGGTSDTFCRRVADALRGRYARATFVENRTGAGGQIAVQAMKSVPADGSMLLQTPASMLMIYPHIYRHLQYDPFEDLAPVSLGCVFEFGFAVGPAVPPGVASIEDFLGWCRADPAHANFGSPGAGSLPHFIGSLLGKARQVDLKHVAYRGTQPAILDLVGGQLSAVSGPTGEFSQQVQAGRIRLLATSGAKRSRFAPAVPTLIEQGFRDMEYTEWFGIFLPRKAPDAVVQRLNSALQAVLADPAVVEGIAIMGLEAASSSADELARRLRRDHDRWGPIVREIGFTAEA